MSHPAHLFLLFVFITKRELVHNIFLRGIILKGKIVEVCVCKISVNSINEAMCVTNYLYSYVLILEKTVRSNQIEVVPDDLR